MMTLNTPDDMLVALSLQLTENPLDTTLRRVYADRCEELGYFARAEEARNIAYVLSFTEEQIRQSLTKKQETELRSISGAKYCPIVVMKDKEHFVDSPTEYGEKGSLHSSYNKGFRLPSGRMCTYTRSTREVRVGVLWLVYEGFLAPK